MYRKTLFAAPLVLSSFAAGVVYGPHTLQPHEPGPNGQALRSPVQQASNPEAGEEYEARSQPFVLLPPEPWASDPPARDRASLPGSSLAGSTERDEPLRPLQPEILGRL